MDSVLPNDDVRLIKDTMKGDPERVYRVINKVFDKLSQQFGDDTSGRKYSKLIQALKKVVGITNESLNSEDQVVLVEFLGVEATSRLLLYQDNIIPLTEGLIMEDSPAITRDRAVRLAFWFDMLMNQVGKQKVDKSELVRTARRAGFELINALADKYIRT